MEKRVSQAQVARTHNLPASTVQLWVKQYRERELAGLVPFPRSDKGKSRSLPDQAITLVEGLALQTPPRSAAAIHRQIVEIAKGQGWKPPSYERVRQIIKNLNPALTTLAHQGAAAYCEEFDLIYRCEATHANAMWQADHTPLDVMLLDEEGKSAKPYLTAIEDDYSRLIVGYRISFQTATALTTALTLRQAIWNKDDPRWSACGIPTIFYTDHGSDFTSKHLEQVAGDIGMELVFSKIGVPRGQPSKGTSMIEQDGGKSSALCRDKKFPSLWGDVRCLSASPCGWPGIRSPWYRQNGVSQTIRAMAPV